MGEELDDPLLAGGLGLARRGEPRSSPLLVRLLAVAGQCWGSGSAALAWGGTSPVPTTGRTAVTQEVPPPQASRQ